MSDLMTREERAQADALQLKIDRARSDESRERHWRKFDRLVSVACHRHYAARDAEAALRMEAVVTDGG